MKLKQRINEWWDERMVERVTRPGLIFLAALVLTGLAAFASANNLIFLLLAVMIATVMISGFVSRLGLAGLELDLLLPDHVTARQATPARLTLKNEKGWFPSFSIRVAGVEGSVAAQSAYFPLVPRGGKAEQTIQVRFARRGSHRGDSFRFSSRFPFGFAERRMKVTMRHEVVVYPSLAPQPGFEQLAADIAGEADARFRGRGHDFYRIRPYEPPEGVRHVDWKKTARTGELMVREFARERDPQVSLLLDLDVEEAQKEWFERAVEGCAYLAWHMAKRAARVRLTTQEIDVLTPTEGDVYTLLRYLALVEPRPGCGPLRPEPEESVAIVWTPERGRYAQMAAGGARVMDPESLPVSDKS